MDAFNTFFVCCLHLKNWLKSVMLRGRGSSQEQQRHSGQDRNPHRLKPSSVKAPSENNICTWRRSTAQLFQLFVRNGFVSSGFAEWVVEKEKVIH